MALGHLQQEQIERIRQSELYTEDTKESEKYINTLICPQCGEKEAYLFKRAPFKLYCSRKNQCGHISDTRELFPVKNIDHEADHPPSADDPHRPATHYLHSRGLSSSLKGLDYEYWPDVRGSGSGAVMFKIDGPDGPVYNGRLFNPPENEGKTHNKGPISGCHWRHPALDYEKAPAIYVTEGVLDALSLIEAGRPAISVLTAGSNPENFNNLAFEKLVPAFDNDEAGRKATRRWVQFIKTKTGIDPDVIVPLQGDWNDYLREHGADDVKRCFDKDYDDFKLQGSLAAAQTPKRYGQLIAEPDRSKAFEFEGRTYLCTAKLVNNNLDVKVSKIGDFTVCREHDQLDDSNSDRPVHEFYLIVKKVGAAPIPFTATAQELSSPQGLKTVLLERSGALLLGDKTSADALVWILFRSQRPVVRQLYITGYDHQSDCYVFKTHMIDPSGELIHPDKRGFYKTGLSAYVRPASQKSILPSQNVDICHLVDLLYRAWGHNALAALGWLVACFFVNQIKADIGFFPFLSLHGDTQTGKSTMLRILNACQCMDEEGLPMRKTNTAKGELRNIAQKSGGFTGLLEWPTESHKARFNIDNILTLFNDNPLQVRAEKTNKFELRKMPFFGALLFAQNREPFIEKKHKERVVSLPFSSEDLSEQSRLAVEELLKITLQDKASFYAAVLAHRVMIQQAWREYYAAAVKHLDAFGVSARIQETHGLVLAFYRIFAEIFNLEYDIDEFLQTIAINKHRQSSMEPESIADTFLSIVLSLDQSDGVASTFLDYRDDKFYVHMPDALQHLRALDHYVCNDQSRLSKSLVEHPECLMNNVTHRFSGKAKKAYMFSSNLVKVPDTDLEN